MNEKKESAFHKTTKTVKPDPVISRIEYTLTHVNSLALFFKFIKDVYGANDDGLVGGRSISSILSVIIREKKPLRLQYLLGQGFSKKDVREYLFSFNEEEQCVVIKGSPFDSFDFKVEKALSLIFDVSDIEPDYKNNTFLYKINFKPSTRKHCGDNRNDITILGRHDEKIENTIQSRNTEIKNLQSSSKEKLSHIESLRKQLDTLERELAVARHKIAELEKENLLAVADNHDNAINSFGRPVNKILKRESRRH